MIYIVDLDKTVFDTTDSDYRNAKPFADRIANINNLFDQGHTIIYWTARGGNSRIAWYDFTLEQLDKAGAKYSELRMNKPSYDLWIDDKAINSEDYFR